jgi:hypothetical protein
LQHHFWGFSGDLRTCGERLPHAAAADIPGCSSKLVIRLVNNGRELGQRIVARPAARCVCDRGVLGGAVDVSGI